MYAPGTGACDAGWPGHCGYAWWLARLRRIRHIRVRRLVNRRHSFERGSTSDSQRTLPVAESSARTFLSRVPVKIKPPAVTTGPTLGKCEPVFLNPFAANSGLHPKALATRWFPG